MDGAAFKEALAKLGHTQSSFAREYRLPVRTIQNWAKSGPPEHMALILTTMLRQQIARPGAIDFSSEDAGTSDAARALDVTLRSVLQRATRAGWPREVAAAGAITWFARQIANKR
jgi:hypothetical protein